MASPRFKAGDLTRFSGRAAQVVSVADGGHSVGKVPWAELRVEGLAERAWAPAWALPTKPSTKGEKWAEPKRDDQVLSLVSAANPPSSAPRSKPDPSGSQNRLQLHVKPETDGPSEPSGTFLEVLAQFMADKGVAVGEVARLLNTTEEAVRSMLDGGRPPLHPLFCDGYNRLADVLGIPVAFLVRLAMEGRSPSKKKPGRGGTSVKAKLGDGRQLWLSDSVSPSKGADWKPPAGLPGER